MPPSLQSWQQTGQIAGVHRGHRKKTAPQIGVVEAIKQSEGGWSHPRNPRGDRFSQLPIPGPGDGIPDSMELADPRQLRALFDAVYEMNAAPDHADFISSVVVALDRLIPSDFCQIHILDRPKQRLMERGSTRNPFSREEIAYYSAHPTENPLVAYYEKTGEQRALRFSDVTPLRALRKTSFYRHCLERSGIVYCLALPVEVDAQVVAGLVFNRRHRDFSRRHCALLDAFAPHFRLAWKHHANPWAELPDATPSLRARFRTRGLTAREADVLFWTTEGKQNREIATILGISLYTVQKHIANILRKLDVENRHALTVLALNQKA